MNRKHVGWGAVSLVVLALLYSLSFGPVVYLIAKAEQKRLFPNWLEAPTTVIFYPHLWACFHYEPYFTYIAWFVNDSGGTFTWQDFRGKHAEKFGS